MLPFQLITLWVVEKIFVHWVTQLHAVGSLPVHNLIDQSDQFRQCYALYIKFDVLIAAKMAWRELILHLYHIFH